MASLDDASDGGVQGRVDALLPLAQPARFLAPSEALGETVVLASYPRSGNSLLRSLLEQVTGITTGSDTRPDRKLSAALAECGARGEGVVDGRAWVVKSRERCVLTRRSATRVEEERPR